MCRTRALSTISALYTLLSWPETAATKSDGLDNAKQLGRATDPFAESCKMVCVRRCFSARQTSLHIAAVGTRLWIYTAGSPTGA